MHRKTVGGRFRIIDNLIRRRFDATPSVRQISNMTGTNAWLIAYIADKTAEGCPVYQKNIEESFHITRSGVSRVVNLMEQKGLLERQSAGHDARLKKLVLTDKARALTEALNKDSEAMENLLTAGFSPEELTQFMDYLDRVLKNLCPKNLNEE